MVQDAHNERKRINKEAVTNRFRKKCNLLVSTLSSGPPEPVKNEAISASNLEKVKKNVRFITGKTEQGKKVEVRAITKAEIDESPMNVPFVQGKEVKDGEVSEKDDQVLKKIWYGRRYQYDGQSFKIVPYDSTKHDEFCPIELLEKHSDWRGHLLFEEVELPSFDTYQNHFQEQKYIYTRVLCSHLEIKCKLLPPEGRNYQAMLRTLMDYYPGLPVEIYYGSVAIHLYEIKDLVSSSTVLTWHAIAPLSKILHPLFTNNAPFTIPATISTFKNDWKYNGLWSFSKCREFQFHYKGNDVLKYPQFTTQDMPVKKCAIAYARFIGHHPSEYYDNHPRNITPALSRMLKQRPLEELLRQNQFRCIGHLPRIVGEVAELCGATFECNMLSGGNLVMRPMKMASRGSEMSSREYNIESYHPAWMRLDKFLGCRKRDTDWYYWLISKLMFFGMIVYQAFCVVAIPVEKYIVELIYSPCYQLYDRVEWLQSVVLLPTPKRRLYQSWLVNQRSLDCILGNIGKFRIMVKWEAGKFMKAPRLYGSGDEFCLVDKIAPEILKLLYVEPIRFDEIYQPMVGPFWKVSFSFNADQSKADSNRMFNEVLNMGPNEIRYFVFSDDMFMATTIGGTLKLYENDISACDSSNGFPIFARVYNHLVQLVGVKTARELISQCAKPCILMNPLCDGESCIMQPESFFEFSGSVLTTALNNESSLVLCFTHYLCSVEQGTFVDFSLSAKEIGFVVTHDFRPNFNSITFLKRAFTGKYSYPVLGQIIRSLCILNEEERAEQFGVSHVEWKLMTNHQKIDRLIFMRTQNAMSGNDPEHGSPFWTAMCRRSRIVPPVEEIHLEDFQDRYGGDSIDWNVFFHAIENLQVGDIVCNDITKRILAFDYGITP